MDPIGWNLKISHWKRRFLVETMIFTFHVNLPDRWKAPTFALTADVTYNFSSIKTSAYDAGK